MAGTGTDPRKPRIRHAMDSTSEGIKRGGRAVQGTGMRWFQMLTRRAFCYSRRGVVWGLVVCLLVVAILGLVFLLLGSVLLHSGLQWEDHVKTQCCERNVSRVTAQCWNERCQPGAANPGPHCYGQTHQVALQIFSNSSECWIDEDRVYTLTTGCINTKYETAQCGEGTMACYLRSCNSTDILREDPENHFATGLWMVSVGAVLFCCYITFCVFGILCRLRSESVLLTHNKEYTYGEEDDDGELPCPVPVAAAPASEPVGS
eukprot:TRINITY_DN17562_c0_g1_i1.p1 TRINITY_DN17562_c0_g1~~TRINITY_DN17562_c0_g1_i1.p1  ORF type:complete len:261 (+),score=69.18 TRINITY_DN17562_c0_g1_i1:57-839(+)